jgi:hypothetical protein
MSRRTPAVAMVVVTAAAVLTGCATTVRSYNETGAPAVTIAAKLPEG